MNQILLDTLKALNDHIGQIQIELDADWPGFVSELRSLPPILDKDNRNLSRLVVKKFYLTCAKRDSVMAVLRQVIDEANIQQILTDRKLEAAGAGQPDEIPIREIANRFQSLLDNLEDFGPPRNEADQFNRDINQPRRGGILDAKKP
jgi:hypothetical protein